ncbi:MAG: hypothetical protein M3198_17585, partial [Actinomycetota bacterium]|nr:hypothetical protein [Actinomycetota bacterium]
MIQLTPFLSLCIVIFLLIFIRWRFSRHPLDPSAFFVYLFSYFYVFRAIIVALGFDLPYPEYLFLGDDVPSLLTQTNILIALYLLSFIFGFAIGGHGNIFMMFLPFTRLDANVKRYTGVIAGLTFVSTLITLGLFNQFASLADVVRATKVDREFAGLYALRIFPSIGSVVSGALLLELLRSKRRGAGVRLPLMLIAIGGMGINSAFVYLWGTRSVAAAALLVLLTGQLY